MLERTIATIRVRAHVTGRVQGVWYRGATCDRAAELGVLGWVRNRRDGCVELEAEGSPEAVEALIAWCRQGPPAARVDSVEVEAVAPLGAATERRFAIRH
jgi:acylphosphatase